MKSSLPLAVKALTVLMAAAPAMVHSTPAAAGSEQMGATFDSIESNADKYEGLARRSLMNGGSKPVSFAGEAIAKFVGSSYETYPSWMQYDRFEAKNSFVTLRTGMVAKPHRNLTLWSKIAFNHALLGNPATRKGKLSEEFLSPTDTASWRVPENPGEMADKRGAILYEDMALGLVGRIGPATFGVKAGGVLWNELSPLTVWKTQPRMFGWDYLPFELEQSTAMFYDYATVKGFKEGRAAWNKKPFQGLQLESVELPWGMYFNALYGYYEPYQKNNPWLVPMDKTTELQYTGETNPVSYATKGSGISDNYRSVYFVRLAKAELPFAVTAGANWFAYNIDEEYPMQWANESPGGFNYSVDNNAVIKSTKRAYGVTTWNVNPTTKAVMENPNGTVDRYVTNYYIEPKVGSIDFRRNIPGGLNFHLDVGFSHVDSIWFKIGRRTALDATNNLVPRFTKWTRSELDSLSYRTAGGVQGVEGATAADTVALYNELNKYRPEFQEEAGTALPWREIGRTTTGWKPAIYGSVSYPFSWAEVELRAMYAHKQFHSGASTIAPTDGIFPYEANLTGPGKFIGSDNGTSYSSNLTGANLVMKLPVPRGHARLSYGYHTQPEKGQDMVWFPWRQNGIAFNATLNSDYTRYGVGLADDFIRAKRYAASGGPSGEERQIRRLGDESFFRADVRNPYAPIQGNAGGLRAEYMATYEGFAAHKIGKAAYDSNGVRVLGTEDSAIVRLIQLNQDSFALLPQHKKSTQSFSVDASYEISRLWNGQRSIFIAGYAALNSVTKGNGSGITKTGLPAIGAGKDILLAGRMLRFEPVVQITPRFYVIGLASQEVWKSDYGVAMINPETGMAPSDDRSWLISSDPSLDEGNGLNNLQRAPIDYTDWMYGLGFDWDIAPRVSLHVRAQYFTHTDDGISVDVPAAKGQNDYEAWLGSTEMKMWF